MKNIQKPLKNIFRQEAKRCGGEEEWFNVLIWRRIGEMGEKHQGFAVFNVEAHSMPCT
jgi:hypothetical protein